MLSLKEAKPHFAWNSLLRIKVQSGYSWRTPKDVAKPIVKSYWNKAHFGLNLILLGSSNLRWAGLVLAHFNSLTLTTSKLLLTWWKVHPRLYFLNSTKLLVSPYQNDREIKSEPPCVNYRLCPSLAEVASPAGLLPLTQTCTCSITPLILFVQAERIQF